MQGRRQTHLLPEAAGRKVSVLSKARYRGPATAGDGVPASNEGVRVKLGATPSLGLRPLFSFL
jgi:hypothetical protein